MSAQPAPRGKWTRDDLLAAGLEWADEFEAPPARAEWNPSLLDRRIAAAERRVEHLKAKRRAHRAGCYPGTAPIIRVFGDWPTYVSALGFTAPRAGAGPPSNDDRLRRRIQARELRELGPLHVRLLWIIRNGGTKIEEGWLTGEADRMAIPDYGRHVHDLMAAGYVERVITYRLTEKGKAELARLVDEGEDRRFRWERVTHGAVRRNPGSPADPPPGFVR
jgi:hypothetical protein